jgi:DNA repair protein SbcC/Rad50
MKLELQNFRCFEHKTFELPDTGTLLVQGPSGVGKTTLIKSIMFCLFGERQNVVRYGKKKCSVTLSYKDIKICRTKGPERLVVSFQGDDGEYEGLDAQNRINNYLNNCHMIYLEQGGGSSFIRKSSVEQCSMLMDYTFQDFDIDKLRDKVKVISRAHEDKLVRDNESLRIYNAQQEEYKDLTLTAMVTDANPEDIRTLIHSTNKQYEDECNLLDNLISQNNKLVRNQELQTMIDDYNSKLYLPESEVLSRLESFKKQINDRDTSIKLQHESEVLQKRIGYIQKSITQYDNNLKDYETKDIYEEDLEWARQINILYTNRNKKQQELNKYSFRDDIDQLLQENQNDIHNMTVRQRQYKCPNCDVNLYLYDDKLNCLNDNHACNTSMDKLLALNNVLKEEQSNKIKGSLIKKQLEDIPEIDPEDYTESLRLLETCPIAIKQIQTFELAKAKLDNELKTCTEQLDVIQQKLDRCGKSFDANLEENVVQYDNLRNLYNQKKLLEQRLDNTVVDPIAKNDIESCKQNIIQYKNRIVELEHQLKLSLYSKLVQKCQHISLEIDNTNDKIVACKTLDSLIQKAKHLTIENTVNTINTHLQTFLDAFFIDNPMTVTIKTHKDVKSGQKNQINIEIDYKGMTATMNMLSGGELDRVSLAFTMAINELTNSPFLILDESVCSLDQDTAGTVFEFIQEYAKDKLVIIVAHQIVSGMFDAIVTLP